MVGVAAGAGAAEGEARVGEGFGHAGFETHGLLRAGQWGGRIEGGVELGYGGGLSGAERYRGDQARNGLTVR